MVRVVNGTTRVSPRVLPITFPRTIREPLYCTYDQHVTPLVHTDSRETDRARHNNGTCFVDTGTSCSRYLLFMKIFGDDCVSKYPNCGPTPPYGISVYITYILTLYFDN